MPRPAGRLERQIGAGLDEAFANSWFGVALQKMEQWDTKPKKKPSPSVEKEQPKTPRPVKTFRQRRPRLFLGLKRIVAGNGQLPRTPNQPRIEGAPPELDQPR